MSTRRVLSSAAAAAAVFGLLGRPAPLPAADAPKDVIQKNTFTDPARATPDVAVQGERVGEVEAGGKKTKLGAQIAATGGGDFVAAFYPGGLPGDGSDGKTRLESVGKADDPAMKEVDFIPAPDAKGPKGYRATWSGGALKGKTDAGAAFELKRVERSSPTMGAKPPEGAVVLFGGKNVDEWENGKIDERGLLAAGARTKRKFKNFALHAEFLLPFKPYGRDQDRGNSGLYLQERYEVQVLDSFAQPPAFNGIGSLYRQTPPDLNMCLPPLQWQTYDIDLTSPEFDAAGAKTKNGVITVKLNGVAVHDKREIKAKTGAGKPEGPEPGPILIQGHGNPVYYRNIWVVEKP